MAKNVSAIVSASGFIAAFWTELMRAVKEAGGSDEDIYRIGKPECNPLIKQFAALIVGAARRIRDFPVWKTVRLGTALKTADDFRKALKTQGCKIGDWANDILGKPAFAASDTAAEADLVKVTVAELGFKEGARYDKICVRGREFGLELCPNEVGPQLRIQYPDQPLGEWLVVAMEPISDSDGSLGAWSVVRDGSGLWLGTDCGNPDDFWSAGNTFVFVRPRK